MDGDLETAVEETLMMDRSTWAWSVSIVGGAVLWIIATLVSGKQEAWDSSLYWSVSYPLSIALAGMVGYWAPDRPWRWGLAVMWAQAVVLVFSAADFGMLPIGLILFSVLALPAVGFATWTSSGRRGF